MTAKRYERNMALPQLGAQGQERLSQAQVCVVGAGGLGSPLLAYLAAAGVGTLHVADADVVEESNLNRQILHPTTRLGQSKAQSAVRTLEALNPNLKLQSHSVWIDHGNCASLLEGADLVVDASDNFATKYLLADYAKETATNLVWGTIVGLHAQVGSYLPSYLTPPGVTLPDLFPTPTAAEQPNAEGVLGAACGVAGSLMASLAIGVLSGGWLPEGCAVTLVDVQSLSVRSLNLGCQPKA